MMLAMRFIHILTGVFWAGAVFFVAGFLLPAMQASGPNAGPVMRQIVAVRRYPIVLMIAAILTVLSGGWMYWRNMSLSSGTWAGSASGITYGIGAVSALLTLALGMAVITPTSKKLMRLGATLAQAGAPPTAEQTATMAALQHRMYVMSRLGALLLAVTVITMGIARYV